MSARQNKKQRKGRNPNNRERTVTTLTEDPNSSYLVPTPSEESPATLMGSNQAYTMAQSFPFNFQPFVQQQPFYQQQQQPRPGSNDLEVLENLKQRIKAGQHEFYRAIPNPAALASIYKGPSSSSQVPHHPEQAPDYHDSSSPSKSGQLPTSDTSRPRKENWEGSRMLTDTASINGGGRYADNTTAKPAHELNEQKPQLPLADSVPPQRSAMVNGNDSSGIIKSDSQRAESRGPPPDERSRAGWSHRDDVPSSDDRRLSDARNNRDRTLPPAKEASRHYDGRDADRERDRDRDRFRYRDDRRMTDARRPPPDQRHYEPDYSRSGLPPRRYDSRDDIADDRRGPPVDERGPRPLSAEERGPRPSLSDDRLSRPPVDSRPLISDSRAPPSSSRDERPIRPVDRDLPPPSGITRPSQPVARIPADDRAARPATLEERISRPSLQDRITQPRAEPPHPGPSLGERLSQSATEPVNGRTPQPDDRLARSTSNVPERDHDRADTARPLAAEDRPPRQDDRTPRPGGDRYSRPVSPPRTSTYTRAPSVAREDTRSKIASPTPRSESYRPPPKLTRPVPNNYRPGEIQDDRDRDRERDRDRDRDRDRVEGYSGPGRFSPPSAADLARDRDRLRRQFAPDPPPREAYDERDRRYVPPPTTAERRDWPPSYSQAPYEGRGRDWDDDYWKYNARGADRDRFDAPRTSTASAWETREERERRTTSYPPVPPPPRAPSPARSSYDPTRPLSTRLTDYPPTTAPAAAGDDRERTYPPPPPPPPSARDARFTGTATTPSPGYTGTRRPRSPSPSPLRTRLAGAPPADDLRPPVKRSRDDYDYYGGRASYERPVSPAQPPPTSAGSSYYDSSRSQPPTSASTVGSSASAEYSREYPATYDRPVRQSYIPRNAGYARDLREERRYMPPSR
ncbi:uncharacterized protein BT62DRAFT_935918 [Guyanagaster necrorhizus]|uniref:Uncharacterized protein n=1 Tax=Guyanagaster necrorhizus TaxID=856835 RepID=A0A9P7VK60_9AGAR|nr:uncharacterized protein BT62DRAFT_935918 [Guyanagaster necrorhizus MCA 3950]KAG7442621.1 hypothetical protein BT62DRAFT_935918 [Guyanagaster necrorhizus MCA 3950]